MNERKNEPTPKLIVLTPDEVRKIQEERKPLTREQVAEIETKIKEVQEKANSEIKKIMEPAVQADPLIAEAVIKDTVLEKDHVLYIIEIETGNGKEIIERRWYFGPTVKEEHKGKFVTTKLNSQSQ